MIFDRIMSYISKLKLVAKKDVVNLVCRYWSLKREARRGAPLLKRIHLEVSSRALACGLFLWCPEINILTRV